MAESSNTYIPVGILTPSGLVDAPYTAVSLADAVHREPGGVYTLGRTFRRDNALLLDDHLNRLEHSAKLEHIALRLDRAAVRRALRTLIDRSGYANSRFRITVPRATPDQIIISLEQFKGIPAEVTEHGVRVITLGLVRHNPAVKSTEWMHERRNAVAAFPPSIYEGLLLSPDHHLLEGTSSNFYGILQGTLHSAGDGVLAGISQKIVYTIAPDILPVEKTPIHISSLPVLEEAFLTSSGRGIIPIVRIDSQVIGNGQPGPLTTQLQHAYDAWVDAHIEPI